MPDNHNTSFAGELTHSALRSRSIGDVRQAIRSGAYRGQTAGLASGLLQANLAILPFSYAEDFHGFCEQNHRPCPLVGVSKPGEPTLPELGEDIDIRTDVPRYNVYRNSELSSQETDITELWQSDFVVFALGCSFTFERALLDAGIKLTHLADNRTVSMYKTNIALQRVGPFGGTMVVSMRAVPRHKIDDVYAVCEHFPHAHGPPIHAGDPAAIGIADLDAPDWGDVTPFSGDDVPLFWACGVTPQNALADARPSICITHTPGHMLLTDQPENVPPRVRPLEAMTAAAE